MLRWCKVSRIFRYTCNRILRVMLYFGKSVHHYMFFFDYWTVFSTLIQFIHELAPRSLWLQVVFVPIRLCRRRNLTTVSNVCEAAPISLFWAPDALNELPEVRFEFPFILIGKSTIAFWTGQSWRVLKSWYTGGGKTRISALFSRRTY